MLFKNSSIWYMSWACVRPCMLACSEYFCSCGVRDDGVSLMVFFFTLLSYVACDIVVLILLPPTMTTTTATKMILVLLLLLIAFHWKWNKIRNSIKIMLKINVTTAQIKRGHSTFVQCASLNFYIIRISFSLALWLSCSLCMFYMLLFFFLRFTFCYSFVHIFEVKLNVFFPWFLSLFVYIFFFYFNLFVGVAAAAAVTTAAVAAASAVLYLTGRIKYITWCLCSTQQ